MFCLDRDLYFRCQHCDEIGIIASSSISIQETGFGSISSQVFSCSACNQLLSFGYSLNADEQMHPGLFIMTSQIYTSFIDILDEVKIIRNPLFVSKISGISPLEYCRTLDAIEDLRLNISSLSGIDRRYFEQVTAELIRSKGFEVEVTKKTRDGGRDIIGITNVNGIPFKLFVECKRKDLGNPIGVDIVRSVYGVHNTQNGPNKSIIVSTTYFTKDARNFPKQEANSHWELGLYDFDDLSKWIADYGRAHKC